MFDILKGKLNDLLKAVSDKSINVLTMNKTNITINLTKNSGFKSNCNSEEVIDLNIDELDDSSKSILGDVVKETFNSCGLIATKESNEKLDLLKGYFTEYDKTGDKKIINFFKPILKKDDLFALKLSLFLRSEFLKHNYDGVKKFKADIIESYGSRGRRISNLCSAGYFDDFLKQLYNSDKEKFRDYFELIVDEEVLAIFVNKSMSSEELEILIDRKIISTKNARFDYLYIHGLGHDNIALIKSCINKNKSKFNFDLQNIIEDSNYNIYIVKIII